MIGFGASVVSGKFSLTDRERHRFVRYTETLKDGDYFLKVERVKKSVSGKQRRYYFGVIVESVCDFMGDHDKDYVHMQLKYKFLKQFNENGEVVGIKGYSDLSTVETEDYHEKIRHFFLTEHQLRIMLPNETDTPYSMEKIYEDFHLPIGDR